MPGDHAEYEHRFEAISQRYGRAYDVEPEDVMQEILSTFYSPKFQARMAELENPLGYVIGTAKHAAQRYCQREKARRGGYRPEDVWTYSVKQIVDLLPAALDSLPRQPPPVYGSGGGLASEGNNQAVMLADIRLAFSRLPLEHASLLRLRFQLDMDIHEMAEAVGSTDDAVRKRIVRAVQKLAAHANQDPSVIPAGKRIVYSNDQAIALTQQ